ncbi:hypothetical protein Tco_0505059 [Tanacetum coccineum]
MTLGEVNTRVTELAELHEHDTQDLYALLEDAQEGDLTIVEEEPMLPERLWASCDRIESGNATDPRSAQSLSRDDVGVKATDGRDSPSDERH